MLARGLAGGDRAELGTLVVQCWDDFLAVAEDSKTDLSKPSRVKGWSGADLCTHLGTWADADPLGAIVDSARSDKAKGQTTAQVDANNAKVIKDHGGESHEAILKSLHASRDATAELVASDEWDELSLKAASSPLGPMALATVLHAGAYELAIHALDLEPCGAPAPEDRLLGRGVAALIDVVGGLAFSQKLVTRVTAKTPEGAWTCISTKDGWTTEPFTGDKPDGAGIRGDAAVLLDTSAGRTNPVTVVLRRKLVPSDLKAFFPLVPLLDAAPGLPGAKALQSAAAGLGKVTKRFKR